MINKWFDGWTWWSWCLPAWMTQCLTEFWELLCKDGALLPIPGEGPLSPTDPMMCSKWSTSLKPRAAWGRTSGSNLLSTSGPRAFPRDGFLEEHWLGNEHEGQWPVLCVTLCLQAPKCYLAVRAWFLFIFFFAKDGIMWDTFIDLDYKAPTVTAGFRAAEWQ